MAEILLKPAKRLNRGGSPEGWHELGWTQGKPFVVNPRGILTHRTKHITTYFREYRRIDHFAVTYLCGNCCCVDHGKILEVTVDDPPEDRLLCERCELMAKIAKLPSGDSLAGRHVHRGVLVPQQTCCRGNP